MSGRTKRFAVGILTGYIAIAANIAYTMASIPLALHYLGKQEFGLWALSQQISGYLLLLDLGLSNAISRFFANWKDDVNGTEYKELFATSTLVYLAQGILIACVGAVFSQIAPWLFHIPESLSPVFPRVLVLLTSFTGFSVACRGLSGPIWAFQRMDLANASMMFTLISSFGMLWLGFHSGWGIYSLALAGIPSALITPFAIYVACRRAGYYPKSGILGRPNTGLFWKLFHFGKDSMLMALGQQMVNASQIMVVSRFIGLEQAATFAIGTKIFTLAQQFVGKVLESASPGLTEIYIRGDLARFRRRFWNMVEVSLALAGIGAAGLILGNQALIDLWTSGLIHWPEKCDVLLGLLLIATTLSRCLTGAFGMIGNLRPIRFVYLTEGMVFLACMYFVTSRYGLIGVIGASLGAHIIVTLGWSIRVQRSFFMGNPNLIKTLASWAMICLVIAMGNAVITSLHTSPFHQLALQALLFVAVCLAVGVYCISCRLFELK